MKEQISSNVLKQLSSASYRCEVNHNWTMQELDDSIEAITGYRADELLGDKTIAYGSLIHPFDKANVLLNVNIAISVNSPFSLEYRIIHKNGEVRWVWEHGLPSTDEYAGMVDGIIIDISEQKHLLDSDRSKGSGPAHDHLGKQILLKEYQQAVDTTLLVYKLSPLGIINYVNPQLCKFTGYMRKELLGRKVDILKQRGENQKKIQDIIANMGSHNIWRGVIRGHNSEGDPYHVKATISAISDDHEQISEYICIQQDVGDVINAAIESGGQNLDPITKLPGRALLLRDLKYHDPAILAVLNINEFKHINEVYGFAVGDQLLYALGEKLSQLCQPSKHTVYRLSADEFAILQWNHHSDEEFIEHIRTVVAAATSSHYHCQSHRLQIELSAGVSARKNQLINAEMAMKHAKSSKAELVFFDKNLAIRQQIIESVYWANKVREAIDHHHITLFTQAIYNNHNGDVDHYECLVRIREDNGDIVPPSKFLGIAKSTKIYPEITRDVICQATDYFAERDEHFSINMSILDAANDETIAVLEQQLAKYPGLGERLIIELVEEEGIEDDDQIAEFIARARGWGCKIAIDDFGSGYSNFDYLMKLDVDYIKLDGSIIRHLDTDSNAELVTSLIVNLAGQLGISTIAEYVHSEPIFNKVKAMGIDYAQGFFINRPEPIAKLLDGAGQLLPS